MKSSRGGGAPTCRRPDPCSGGHLWATGGRCRCARVGSEPPSTGEHRLHLLGGGGREIRLRASSRLRPGCHPAHGRGGPPRPCVRRRCEHVGEGGEHVVPPSRPACPRTRPLRVLPDERADSAEADVAALVRDRPGEGLGTLSRRPRWPAASRTTTENAMPPTRCSADDAGDEVPVVHLSRAALGELHQVGWPGRPRRVDVVLPDAEVHEPLREDPRRGGPRRASGRQVDSCWRSREHS